MLRFSITASAALVPGLAFAHTGLGATHGVSHGFAHPFGGLDHVLAMMAVGLLAAELGRTAMWLLPTLFLSAMAAGGALAMAGIGLPFVEIAVAGSVLVLGLLVASPRHPPLVLASALVALFAAFHGQAHGAEMPASASGLGYGLGFLAATMLLHLGGIGLGLAVARLGAGRRGAGLRWAGAATSVAGLVLLVGLAA